MNADNLFHEILANYPFLPDIDTSTIIEFRNSNGTVLHHVRGSMESPVLMVTELLVEQEIRDGIVYMPGIVLAIEGHKYGKTVVLSIVEDDPSLRFDPYEEKRKLKTG